MSKRYKRNSSYVDQKRNLVIFVAVFISVALIGGTLLPVFYGGSNSIAGNGAQTSNTTAIESQIKTLADQVYAKPEDLTLRESLGSAYFNLATTYRQNNDPRNSETFIKAIDTFKEVIKKDPNNKATLGDLATAYFYSGQVDQAIETVEKALKADPNFAPARMNYAVYLAEGKGDFLNAIKQLEKVPTGTEQYTQAQGMIKQYTDAMSAPAKSPAPTPKK